ncbi:hypothetical protein EV198_2076 [Roseivirga ehrenbergii]|uniref:Uncharacterized protein n=1 Tax=Roseivirga ehrenbergii (strain DSM 102268 / JCM 13514 / KCTC 12282 / NCIMB 14502 / KMM 6017) TaxID=279360 RepID=A0A150WYW8_ROSEK|nr:hypothetical protein [Roseivirga ehrenbergii]KYG71667.1 hypothetical protein MB14_10130 [Roseivirga ehrenbergii]TCL07643.1 hypothetical protein EV198_2076 [Roseivirga ehrenbergii]
MDDRRSRSERFGIKWRWLFLVGGIFYLANGISSMIKPREVYDYLGFSFNRWVYIALHLVVAFLLLKLFIKNQKLLRQQIKDEVMRQHNEEH